MLISKKWLSEFVTLPDGLTDQELARTVTLSTVEVESFVDQAAAFANIVVGVVESVAPHPNADRLKVCQVDVGGRVTQIVCGGTNVREGLKVVVALPGSRVRWHGEGDLIELAKTKIRGESSEGMICAAAEVGLDATGEPEHGIVELGTDAPAGTPLADVLGKDDVIFDIEHKSLTNRPDLMGHYGMARELSALYKVPLVSYGSDSVEAGSGAEISVDVEDAALCPRYMAVVVDGVTVGPSPAWLRERLAACGVRSINNVVDVTNYVMLDLGQPMHAFDAARVGGDDVVLAVRSAKKGETLACLDDATYELEPGMLLVTAADRLVAIAGVMGGMDSAVTDVTTRVVLESANFSPVSVRKTSTKLGLRSESSARFEKSLDPENCAHALRRAVDLLRAMCPESQVVSEVVDAYPNPPTPVVLSLSVEEITSKLGADISAEDVTGILSRLCFGVQKDGAALAVTVPSWRATKDVSIKEDVIEEVARIWGYGRIPSALPAFAITPPAVDRVRELSRLARTALASRFAATEAYHYAFVSPETLAAFRLPADAHLELANPLSKERPYLVRTLVPNLAESVRANQRAFESVRLFEVARAFLPEQTGMETGDGTDALPGQSTLVAGAFSAKGAAEPFWEAKAMALGVLEAFGYRAEARAANVAPWSHPTRAARVFVGEVNVGFVAELDPQVASAFGLDNRVAAFELSLDAVAALAPVTAAYEPVPAYPPVLRDLAFVVDERVEYAAAERAVRAASPLVVAVDLFDVYRGKGVAERKKSLAVHLSLRADDRTLSSEEVETEVAKVTAALQVAFDAELRA